MPWDALHHSLHSSYGTITGKLGNLCMELQQVYSWYYHCNILFLTELKNDISKANAKAEKARAEADSIKEKYQKGRVM